MALQVFRSKMAQAGAEEDAAEDGVAGEGAVEPAFDPLEFVEAVDVMAALPDGWFDAIAAATK